MNDIVSSRKTGGLAWSGTVQSLAGRQGSGGALNDAVFSVARHHHGSSRCSARFATCRIFEVSFSDLCLIAVRAGQVQTRHTSACKQTHTGILVLLKLHTNRAAAHDDGGVNIVAGWLFQPLFEACLRKPQAGSSAHAGICGGNAFTLLVRHRKIARTLPSGKPPGRKSAGGTPEFVQPRAYQQRYRT